MRITMGRPEKAARGMSNPHAARWQNDPQHSLISAAYQLICIIALRSSWSWMTAKYLKRECSPEDIVMPMCQSPQISDALLQASRLPANDNPLPVRSSREPKSSVKTGWQAILICVTALLLERLTCLIGGFRT
jgi:hypothetical protein